MKDKFNKKVFEEGLINSYKVETEPQEVKDIQEFETINSDLLWKIFFSRDIAHIKHIQTESFAQHKALNEYYDNILGIIDSILETFQGDTKTKLGFSGVTITQETVDTFEQYLETLKNDIDTNKSSFSSDIENKLEEVKTEINSLLYKLNFLK